MCCADLSSRNLLAVLLRGLVGRDYQAGEEVSLRARSNYEHPMKCDELCAEILQMLQNRQVQSTYGTAESNLFDC